MADRDNEDQIPLGGGTRTATDRGGPPPVPEALLLQIQSYLPAFDRSNVLQIDDDTELRSLGLDSLKQVQLLVELEDRYGIEVPDEQLDMKLFANPASLWAVVSPLLSAVGVNLQTEGSHPGKRIVENSENSEPT